MAITVTGIVPNTSNVESYSVIEEATPIAGGDFSGGVGAITIGAASQDDAEWLYSESFTLSDSARGSTEGIIRDVSGGEGSITLGSDSVLVLFNADRSVLPFVGTFDDAIAYYASLVDVTTTITMSGAIAARSVVYSGWNGNLWDMLKSICVVEKLEIALVNGEIVFRVLRSNTLLATQDDSDTWNVSASEAAQAIEVVCYNNTNGAQMEIYPVAGEDPAIYQVDASETLVVDLPVSASVTSVNQPVATDWVEADTGYYQGTDGVYSIAGNDNLPYLATQWLAEGGLVTVSLTEDPSVIRVTIVGASGTAYAPYRIAMTSGNYYNSLHITANAILQTPEVVTIYTGAPKSVTGVDVGVKVENPFIGTKSIAYDVGMRTAGQYAGTVRTESKTTGNITSDFGTVAGSRVSLDNDTKLRVTQATITADGISYNAVVDVLASDFTTVWAGKDAADFTAFWVDHTARDFSIKPLKVMA